MSFDIMTPEEKGNFNNTFKRLFPGKRLLAIHLDGFSHSILYDSGKKTDEIEIAYYSGCAPEQNKDDRVTLLLGQFPHFCFQNNAQEVIFVHPEER